MGSSKNIDLSMVILLFSWLFLSAIGQILIKQGLNQLKQYDLINNLHQVYIIKLIASNIYIFLGMLLLLLSILFFLICLSKIDMSYIFPLGSLTIVLIIILSYFYLGESISLSKGIGILFVLSGCVFLGLKKRKYIN